MRVFPLVIQGPEEVLGELLWGLTCRVASYPGVRGMLYSRLAAKITVWIVAARPISRPMGLLAAVWAREVERADPSHRWTLRVSEDPPKTDGSYRCLFWRSL